MDVTNVEQAMIAEQAGACAVMALERIPSDIRKDGGVARMSNIKMIREILSNPTLSNKSEFSARVLAHDIHNFICFQIVAELSMRCPR